jgi:ABC-type Fe3+-hydroxamate transport system substrate-binding protein
MKALEVADERGRVFSLRRSRARIVSLVPSDTYMLYAFGAGERVVGRTDYCIEPDAALTATAVGGTKNPDIARVIELQPDLVLMNQEENTERDAARLDAAGVPTFVSFPKRVATGLAHAAKVFRLIGDATDEGRARLRAAYAIVRDAEAHSHATTPIAAFVPIWFEPWMTIHAETTISDTLTLSGMRNVFADRRRRYPLAVDLAGREVEAQSEDGRDTRYPRVTIEEIARRDPEVILLPDEPFAFGDAHRDALAAAFSEGKTRTFAFVSGRDLMWSGLRGIEGIPRLQAIADRHQAAQKNK